MTEFTWTRPYYGVQHLEILPKPKSWIQISIADYEEYGYLCDAYVLLLGRSFTPVAEEHFRGPDRVARAQAWAVEKAKMFLG